MGHLGPYLIGIDGGGTGCRAAISDRAGNILGSANGGPANYTSDPDGTVRNLIGALGSAARNAGLDLPELANVPAHVGLAGIVSPETARALAAKLPLLRCTVTDDQVTTVFGALGDRNGVVISVGTGSFIAVKRGANIRHIGGWGLQLGDQASGAWLGRKALQRCALTRDGLAQNSGLTTRIWQDFNNDPAKLIAFAQSATPADFATYATEVMAAATQADSQAIEIVAEATAYLSLCLETTGFSKEDHLCLTGGLGPLFAQWLPRTAQNRLTGPRGTALDGALALARQMVP
ncbi:BadF/BadG/BcrA/BcrD ATPase family protein [Marivita sp.]|uniref:BadF/BadG/BcrA/BcrD ATPase family protein n=1 Tax=Marivita sp. TaxID=2003365 RepID=UPI0025C33345|nr:BadF/BadG/BcrA/BcrD ATPase family protein [Marivita sp.]